MRGSHADFERAVSIADAGDVSPFARISRDFVHRAAVRC
ncbi:hypothetical protein BURPS305_3094 [Burkholderia pseudomallei 305]|nr:hypothetical protein BURPS305_3094 [Burkholderia pseudomallei 305]